MTWSELDLSSQECKTREFPTMDIMKFLCSILVVMVHVNPFTDANPYLSYAFKNYLARLTVPFFFVSGGYLCFRKTTPDDFDCRIPFQYAKRMMKLYLIWVVIYILDIVYYIEDYESGLIPGVLSWLKEIVFIGYGHLWYLTATAFAVVVISVALNRKIPIQRILVFGAGLYLVGALGNTYIGLLKYIPLLEKWMRIYLAFFDTTRNGLFEGLVFIGMGALFAFERVSIPRRTAVGGLCISLCFLCAEAYAVEYFRIAEDYNLYVFLLPATFLLFYCVLHTQIHGFRYGKTMRTYSSLIYFTHSWLDFPGIPVVVKVVEKCTGNEYELTFVQRFAAVMAGTIVVSFVIDKLQHHQKFRWLRKIY